jgi:hypothetical protein
MSKARPFGYHNGPPIPGTEQYGNLVVGVGELDYVGGEGGVRWWNGPDEDLGYVIAKTNVNQLEEPQQPTPNTGQTINGITYPFELGGVGFNRTAGKNTQLFIDMAMSVTGQYFETAPQAKLWLETNGYWTSWGADWILDTGFWDDNNVWVDDAVWID